MSFSGNSTSLINSAIEVTGALFGIGDGASPENFTIVANATDWSSPTKVETVDVTNFGDQWRRRKATLNDMGETKFKLFWVMTEPTHENVSGGLRYLMINRIKKDFGFQYPDGHNSTDIIPGYITSFAVTGKVGGVFEAEITLTNDGAPTLV
jgi:hypothetical protein